MEDEMQSGGAERKPRGFLGRFKADSDSIRRFESIRMLGEGCMGGVYSAYDTRAGMDVALKIAHKSPNAIEAHKRELRALMAIKHPNIANLLDSGRFGDGPFNGSDFMVLDLVPEENLSGLLNAGRMLPLGLIRRALADICSALCAVHKAGFIHRDIKASNVMLTENGARLVDFGVSERIHGGSLISRLFRLSFSPGNLAYAAPELFGGKTDERCDIYALGILAYALSTGRLPQLPYWMDSDTRSDIECVGERMPPGAAGIILRAVRERAEERFQSAREMLDAIQRHWPFQS